MKKLKRPLCMLTVLSGLLFIISCSKKDRSAPNTANDAMTVARSVLPKVSFTDSNFTVPIEVVSVMAANLNKTAPAEKLFKRDVALSVENSFTINDSAGSPNMYIFNYKEDGYAVFSADERYNPLLAVVEKGKFEKRAISAGLINWFDVTMNYINLAKKGIVEKRGAAEAEWRLYLKQPVIARGIKDPEGIDCCVECPNYPACLNDPYMGCGDPSICGDPCGVTNFYQRGPYITTVWDQGCGYNDLSENLGCTSYPRACPSNYNAPTGCVATAMAQIIKYWAHPTH